MRRQDIDSYKGLAIIVVVLFHLGLLRSGYLGVDLFFVINGFLVIPSLFRKIETNSFKYFDFMKVRLYRLYPLIIIATTVCLILGYIVMLPDNYENLSQAIVASNLMSENILSSITTHDYWNTVNEYNPLMHLWYIGVLFEFYLCFPILLMVAHMVFKGKDMSSINNKTLYVLTSISFLMFILPGGDKFYFLPYRFFEIALGGIVATLIKEKNALEKSKRGGIIVEFSLVILVIVLFSGLLSQNYETLGCTPRVIGYEHQVANEGLFLPKTWMLLITVLLSCIVLIKTNRFRLFVNPLLSTVGKMSYSIFIWHQVVLAFLRYVYDYRMPPSLLLIYFCVVAILSWFSYRYIESTKLSQNKVLIPFLCIAVVVTGWAFNIYMHAGVVRDVPELNITKENVHRGMHGDYCDRIYDYDKDFEHNDRTNVLCIGNSFARDMANVLLESNYADSINLSYIFSPNESYADRIKSADVILVFGEKTAINQVVWDNVKDKELVYGIGTKHFGVCNGNIYRKRGQQGYYAQKAELYESYKDINNRWMLDWGDNYINLLKICYSEEEGVALFTDNNKLISQDCYHLTQEGARWFANRLNIEKLLINK